MVRALIVSVALALASADFCNNGLCDEREHASLMQTAKTTKSSGQSSPSLKETDLLVLLDSLVAHPQSTAEELVRAEPSVQQALVQRANEKSRKTQLFHAALELPSDKKLELLRAAKTSPEVGLLFRSLSEQAHMNLIEMAKADSVDAAVVAKDGDWWDLSGKNNEPTTQAPGQTTTQAPEQTTTQAPAVTTTQAPAVTTTLAEETTTMAPAMLMQMMTEMDLLVLLDSLIAHPQLTAEELVRAEPSLQQALVQRANEKSRKTQLLHAALNLPRDKKLELLRAAKTSPEVGLLFRSLSEQAHMNLIEMAKADSVDAAMVAKDGDWWDLSGKNKEPTTQAPGQTTTQAPEQTTTQAPEQTTTQAPEQTTTQAPEETTTGVEVTPAP